MGEYRENEVGEVRENEVRCRRWKDVKQWTQAAMKDVLTASKENILHSSQQGQSNTGTGVQRGCGIPILADTQTELDMALNNVLKTKRWF